MEKNDNFIQSLVKYGSSRLTKLPINPWYAGTGIVMAVMIMSALNLKISVAYMKNKRQVIEKAARVGDYQTANNLLEETGGNNVLGLDVTLEELVYPERKIEREISKYEELNAKYPGSRDVLLSLSELYIQLGNVEKAKLVWEQARKLDPNNDIFKDK